MKTGNNETHIINDRKKGSLKNGFDEVQAGQGKAKKEP